MISFHDVNLGYQKEAPVLLGVNFTLNQGDLYVLCGASGTGKSTFFDSLAGYNKPFSGTVLIEKKDIYSLKQKELNCYRRKMLSYLPQEQCLIDSLDVMGNICLPMVMNANANGLDEITERVKLGLKRFGIEELSDKYPRELSGGEIKRVEILQHLLKDSSIMLLDEPTNNLDDYNVKLLIEVLKEKCKEGKLIIVSTHDERLMNIDGTKKIYIKEKKAFLDE